MSQEEKTSSDRTIILSGPFVAKSSRGEDIPVKSLSILRYDYTPDVAVPIDWPTFFEKSVAKGDKFLQTEITEKMRVWDDEVFISGVMTRLKELGYEGEPFSRAESGMQSAGHVILEPNKDFKVFAKAKGWQDLDDLENPPSPSRPKP